MTLRKKIRGTTVRIIRDDLTNLDVDALVFYARHDLALGSGFGNAIAQRGGPSIQEEAKKLGKLETTQAVTTGAGELKAKHIIHAVGPRFQESDTKNKLHTTLKNVLEQARSVNVEKLALPPMGVGFYGVPPKLSAEVTLAALEEHLRRESNLQEVVICCTDSREIEPFKTALESY